MWFFYMLPIFVAIVFVIANRGRSGPRPSARALLFPVALIAAVSAAGVFVFHVAQ